MVSLNTNIVGLGGAAASKGVSGLEKGQGLHAHTIFLLLSKSHMFPTILLIKTWELGKDPYVQ